MLWYVASGFKFACPTMYTYVYICHMVDDTCVVLEFAGTLEDPSQASLPDIQIQLGNKPSLCNFGLFTYGLILDPAETTFIFLAGDEATNSTRDDSTGLFTRKFLFQNYQACVESRSSLTNVTGIGFSSNTANVSFCLEDFKLLPTQVPSTGELHMHSIVVAPAPPSSPPVHPLHPLSSGPPCAGAPSLLYSPSAFLCLFGLKAFTKHIYKA